MRRLPFVALVIFGMLGLVPVAASAAPLTCPTTIMHNTTLHADLDCTGVTSGYAVQFGKPGLTLDLNGHTIQGPVGGDSASGVYTQYNNDTITGGTISNFDEEIYAYGAIHTVINAVHMVADTSDFYPVGVYIEYGGSDLISHNTATNFYEGLDFYGSGGNAITHNTLKGNTYGSYSEYESNDKFIRNRASGNEYGIYDDYSDKNIYRANTANSNTYYGLYLDCDTYGVAYVLNNTANYNSVDDGIYAYECFYDYGSTTAYTVMRGNTASHNGDYGIDAEDPLSYVISGNTTNGNQDDTGLYIEDNETLYQVQMVANNVANNNSDYGIYADYDVPQQRAANNSAAGNATRNCFNIACS